MPCEVGLAIQPQSWGFFVRNVGSWGPCFRGMLWVEALASQVHREDGRQALCMEPDAWKPPDTVHCPHCRSGWNVSVLILEWSNSTAKKQMLNDTATLSLVLLPLATPNLTREMLPKSRSADWGNFMSTLLFLGQGFSTLVFWVLESASSL